MRPAATAACAVVVLTLSACGADGARVAMLPSSMSGLTDEIDAALPDDTDWVIAGSPRLVGQLADGAHADLLVTADRETMQSAIDQDLVSGTPAVIAGNRLVLAVAPGNPGGVDELADLAEADLLVGVCAREVPCGRLALEAEHALDLDVAADTEEPNVRSLALKVAGGELDAGLIYATDAAALDLATVDDDPLAAFATEYVAVSLTGRPSEIIAFLTSGEGREILRENGFTLP